jgi:hypothetical protein
MSENSERYPIDQRLYTKCVGSLLQHRVGQILKDLGYRTKVARVESNGVDLKVYKEESNLILVGEIINWSCCSYPNKKRKKGIIRNLSQYPCRKLLIYSTMGKEFLLESLESQDISKLKIGYQLLPRHFYDHFARQNKILYRRVDSRETTQDIRAKIANLLQSFGIEP